MPPEPASNPKANSGQGCVAALAVRDNEFWDFPGRIYGCLWVYIWVIGQMFETVDIPITPEVLTLIAEIDEFKGAWRALGTLAPERLSALRRVATIESIGSSTRIEGSKLSDRDVERLLANLEIKSFARASSRSSIDAIMSACLRRSKRLIAM